jgi:hypothetical protein
MNRHPDEIPKLLARLSDETADIVIGSRFLSGRPNMLWYRRQGIRAMTRLSSGSEIPITDAQSSFRAYNRRAIDTIMPAEQSMGASTEILMRAVESGLKLAEVPVGARYEGLETSSQNPLHHGLDVTASILKFISMRYPLRFYGGIGAGALSASVTFGLWALTIYSREGRLVTNLVLLATGLGVAGSACSRYSRA